MTVYQPDTEGSAYALANRADSYCPDDLESAGAQFLTGVRDSLAEAIAYEQDNDSEFDAEDAPSAIADEAVPVYTRDIWATFVDLGAYTEDPSELGYDASTDMEQLAKVCLYMVAERLVSTLLEEWEADTDAHL